MTRPWPAHSRAIDKKEGAPAPTSGRTYAPDGHSDQLLALVGTSHSLQRARHRQAPRPVAHDVLRRPDRATERRLTQSSLVPPASPQRPRRSPLRYPPRTISPRHPSHRDASREPLHTCTSASTPAVCSTRESNPTETCGLASWTQEGE